MINKKLYPNVDAWENTLNLSAFSEYLGEERRKFANLNSEYTHLFVTLQGLAGNDQELPDMNLVDIHLTANKSLTLSRLLV